MSDAFSLAGKRFLVTGGTRGIGRAIALRFAHAGATVIANYAHNEEAAQSLAAEAGATGAPVELCRADLTSQEGKKRVLDAVGTTPLSGLVHCAATGVHRRFEDLTLRHWDFTLALNLRAFFDLVQALLPMFGQGSSIVALSSEGAVHAFPQYALVGASKGGLEALCRHLAVELAPRNIRVNVLSPGSILTEAWDAFPDKEIRLHDAISRSPRGQLTTLEEVAWAAQFLCSAASAGVNGHTLVVDGGLRVRG
ncbi:MAG: SDR family oxidoreductase [Luteitalea sp.]|nr:SDR family oxidoreductase [Luteitalea sp.]